MARMVNVRFRIRIIGNGRDETIFRQPMQANADFTQVTSGAVTLNSCATFTQTMLQPGWNQLVDEQAYLTAPTTRSYFTLQPPVGSTFPKVLAGATTDVGVSLVPNGKLRLALPRGPVSIYIYQGGPTAEPCDRWDF
jgi:hypothetical protein